MTNARSMEEFQGLTTAEGKPFETSTTASLGFHGRSYGYVVTASTTYDVGNTDVAVYGVLYTVTTTTDRRISFSHVAVTDPRQWVYPAPGKYERHTTASRIIPSAAGRPAVLEVYLVESVPAANGLSIQNALVERQVFAP
jgi:hypothetical protein